MYNLDLYESSLMKEEMQFYKEEAEQSLGEIVGHKYAGLFCKVLAHAFLEDNQDAYTLAQRFELNQKHFLAIDGQFERFKEECDSERFDIDGESHYESRQEYAYGF